MNEKNREVPEPVYDPKDVPEGLSDEEQIRFWETHDVTEEFLAKVEEVPEEERPRPRTRPINLRFDVSTISRLKELATLRNVGYQTMTKEFVVQRLYEEEKREGILPTSRPKGVSPAPPRRIEDDLRARGVVQLLMPRKEHAQWVAELDLMQIPPEIDRLRKERDQVEQAKESEELRRLAELQEELRRGKINVEEALDEAARTRVPFEEIEARYTSRLVALHNIGEWKIEEESNIPPEEAERYLRKLRQKTVEQSARG